MADQIETTADGRAAAIFARTDAWHRLGTVVAEDDAHPEGKFTQTELMELGHLGGWDVRKEEIITASGLKIPGKYAVTRRNPFAEVSDEELAVNPFAGREVIGGGTDVGAVVGNWWKPFQNEDGADLLRGIIDADEDDPVFTTAASLQGGKHVFITVELPNTFMVGGVDAHKVMVAFLNSHDGTKSARLFTTFVRIVCANTQRMAENAATDKLIIRHSGNLDGKVQVARDVLKLTFKEVENFQRDADRMIQAELRKSDETQLTRRLFKLIPPGKDASTRTVNAYEKKLELVSDLINDPSNSGKLPDGTEIGPDIRGTRWGLFNAYTLYLDHVMSARHDKDASTAVEDEANARAERVIVADYIRQEKDRAWNLLVPAGK